jgi:DNA-binding PadR family transcriptional regulator
MSARTSDLGEFEQLVLLAAFRLGADAYAPRIAEVLEERAHREMSRGTLYGALDQLERKGLIEFSVEPPTERRGGRQRRRFTVTAAGIQSLAQVRAVVVRMWEGLDERLAEEGA